LLKFSNTPVNPLWPFKLRAIIRRERPDVIIAHSPVPSMADAAAVAAGKTPFVLVYHAATLRKGGSLLFNVVAWVYGLFGRFTFARADRVVAVSGYVKDGFGARVQHKAVIVPNGVWAREVVARSQPGGTDLLFIGSLDKTHAWKGLELIIRAVGIYKVAHGTGVRLTVMGDGNARHAYERLVTELGLGEDIAFVGAKTGAEKDAYIVRSDAVLQYPTSGNDAFPTVLLEAWAKGVPVIAAAMGPLPSIINDKLDGYLVTPNDPTALAAAIDSFVHTTAAERSRIAGAAAKRTAGYYTWEHHAASLAKVVGDVV
jgi:glycosyltransferase involved in cell wall biosynthesis